METQNIVTFLLAYSTAVAICALSVLLPFRPSFGRLIVACGALLSVVGVVMLGSILAPASNVVVETTRQILSLNRPYLVSAAMGLAAALPIILFLLPAVRIEGGWSTKAIPWLMSCAFLGLLITGGLLAGKDLLSPFLPHPHQHLPNGSRSLFDQATEPGFVLEPLATTTLIPIRIVVTEKGSIYVSGQVGLAAQSGSVMELLPDPQSGMYAERLIASWLNRPFGLAFYKNDLYVSRSGAYTQWSHGTPKHFNTGAVTMLRDLNGDGIMDYYHDVVPNLPGARGPDYLHQNNGIAFGADGSLFITSGISSDTHPPQHEWEGTILRATPPDYKVVEVFARGLRNTFGLSFGPDGELFATDNDAQSGVLANLGDKLVHVKQGSHFGHPYAAYPNPGVDKPLWISQFALTGMTYTEASALPEKYRRCLYVVSYGDGKILRIALTRQGASYEARPYPFAIVPGATDIASDKNGHLYVATYANGRIFRIRYVGQ